MRAVVCANVHARRACRGIHNRASAGRMQRDDKRVHELWDCVRKHAQLQGRPVRAVSKRDRARRERKLVSGSSLRVPRRFQRPLDSCIGEGVCAGSEPRRCRAREVEGDERKQVAAARWRDVSG